VTSLFDRLSCNRKLLVQWSTKKAKPLLVRYVPVSNRSPTMSVRSLLIRCSSAIASNRKGSGFPITIGCKNKAFLLSTPQVKYKKRAWIVVRTRKILIRSKIASGRNRSSWQRVAAEKRTLKRSAFGNRTQETFLEKKGCGDRPQKASAGKGSGLPITGAAKNRAVRDKKVQ
jgi:hypothetical protein